MPLTSVSPPLWTWSSTKLRNSEPEFLMLRLVRDIKFTAVRCTRRRDWRRGYLRPVIAALFPADLDDLVSLDNSLPAAVEAANADVAFLFMDHHGDDAAKTRAALAIALWLTGARRTTLNVAQRWSQDDPDLDENLSMFLNIRRIQKFKKDLRLVP